MWMEGKSAKEIGLKIEKSRSAVLGKIFRLKMLKVARKAPKKPALRVAKEPKKIAKVKKIAEVKPAVAPPAPANFVYNRVVKPPTPVAKAPPAKGISLADMHYRRDCAFPQSGRGADTIYCGAPTAGKPYCPKCRKIMYTSNQRRGS
jgi:hypothetical protein